MREHGVSEALVLAHWRELRPTGVNGNGSANEPNVPARVRGILRPVEELLFDAPRPLEIATEHLLLGLLLAENALGAWLGEQGLFAEPVLRDIRARHGLEAEPGPPIEMPEEPAPPISASVDDLPTAFPAPVAVRAVDDNQAILRILDASANRAREGLRVVEDYARFVLDDSGLTELAKELRHDLSAALSALPGDRLLLARDTEHDVGVSISTLSEGRRAEPADVAIANLKRTQEALRSLEEYGKLLATEFGSVFESLRYRTYTLERRISLRGTIRTRLQSVRLYVLIRGRSTEEKFRRLAEELVTAGADALQLREKNFDDRTLLSRARLLREITRGSETLFLMNDRPDLARLADADGVHVGQEELSVPDARMICGGAPLVGLSTHNIEQARDAVRVGADYIGVGPTFPSGTKHFERFTGLELLREVAAEIALPAFAIGGVNLDNLADVVATGIRRVAVSGAIAEAAHPGEAAREFLAGLNS